jgi:hypothetical protein
MVSGKRLVDVKPASVDWLPHPVKLENKIKNKRTRANIINYGLFAVIYGLQ